MIDGVRRPRGAAFRLLGQLVLADQIGNIPVGLLDTANQLICDQSRDHASGDFGDLCAEDEAENRFSLEHGYRIFSSYTPADDERVWVISEAD